MSVFALTSLYRSRVAHSLHERSSGNRPARPTHVFRRDGRYSSGYHPSGLLAGSDTGSRDHSAGRHRDYLARENFKLFEENAPRLFLLHRTWTSHTPESPVPDLSDEQH